MDSNIFKIYLTDRKTKMKDLLKENEHDLSMKVVEKICYAIDNDLNSVDIAKIYTPMEVLTIHSTKPNFLSTLEVNLKTLIQYEEYEMCALAYKHIEYLKELGEDLEETPDSIIFDY